MNTNSYLEHYGRRSLFDNQSRDILSLKRQVPLARVREYLAGSGKNSENSNHFDRSLAQYFRPQRLGKGAIRNHNNSMTENFTNTNTMGTAEETSMLNKSQLIPSQP